MIWKLHHQKTRKYTKCLNKKIFLKVHFEFLDNKHKRMKVVDAFEQICWYTTMCHLLKGFPPKFYIFKFQILSWNTITY
jgi:hypothetical protein